MGVCAYTHILYVLTLYTYMRLSANDLLFAYVNKHWSQISHKFRNYQLLQVIVQ